MNINKQFFVLLNSLFKDDNRLYEKLSEWLYTSLPNDEKNEKNNEIFKYLEELIIFILNPIYNIRVDSDGIFFMFHGIGKIFFFRITDMYKSILIDKEIKTEILLYSNIMKNRLDYFSNVKYINNYCICENFKNFDKKEIYLTNLNKLNFINVLINFFLINLEKKKKMFFDDKIKIDDSFFLSYFNINHNNIILINKKEIDKYIKKIQEKKNNLSIQQGKKKKIRKIYYIFYMKKVFFIFFIKILKIFYVM